MNECRTDVSFANVPMQTNGAVQVMLIIMVGGITARKAMCERTLLH